MSEEGRDVLQALQFLVLAINRYTYRVAHTLDFSPRDIHAVGIVTSQRFPHGLTVGQLGSLLGLSRAATSAALDRLEDAGHLQRSRSLPDARKVSVYATDYARQVSAEMFAPLNEAIRGLLESMDDEQVQQLRDTLAELTATIDATAPPTGHGTAALEPPAPVD